MATELKLRAFYLGFTTLTLGRRFYAYFIGVEKEVTCPEGDSVAGL